MHLALQTTVAFGQAATIAGRAPEWSGSAWLQTITSTCSKGQRAATLRLRLSANGAFTVSISAVFAAPRTR